MKRSLWFLLSVMPLLAASCDRRTVAHAVLTAGFNSSLRQVVSPTEEPTPSLVDFGAELRELEDSLAQLQRLREHPDTQTLHGESFRTLIDRVVSSSESLSQRASETEAALLGETKLAALAAGADVFPATYAHVRDAWQQQLFSPTANHEQAGAASAQRYIREYLVRQANRDEALRYLSLHSLLYPQCAMNVPLYVTTAQWLANERQVARAVEVSKQGLRRCALLADVQLVAEQLERIYAAHPGAPGVPMNFGGPLLGGGRFELESTRGHPVLVVFWATWSPRSRDEIAIIRDLHQRYQRDGLQVVGVSLDDDRRQLDAFLRQQHVSWPQVFTDKPSQTRWNNAIARYYSVEDLPRTFLLDADGAVFAAGLQGDFEIESAILDLLAEQES